MMYLTLVSFMISLCTQSRKKVISDEHGVIEDKHGALRINEKLRLIPGHCDPTCNLHDWYVGVRNGKVEVVWPVSARGKAY